MIYRDKNIRRVIIWKLFTYNTLLNDLYDT